MSYEFLAGYTIPLLAQPPPAPAQRLSGYEMQPGAPIETTPPSYPQTMPNERFIPPGLHGTDYQTPAPRPPKRKHDAGPAPVKTVVQVETTTDTKIVMFQGRDTSYPDELNKLIHPLHCELCGMHMNSPHSAKDHYQSKTHDRNISVWLTKNYILKGIDPPAVKRFVRDGPAGPNAFHCELCDLDLTSQMHANQHYAGRKHRLVANKISQPSGAGYYNKEGKWVRTGSKYVPPVEDGRFGIGEQFKTQVQAEPPAADTTTPSENDKAENVAVEIVAAPAAKLTPPLDTSLYCQVCKVSVTSHSQMTMHLNGSKHQKKLKQSGMEQTMGDITKKLEEPVIAVSGNSILEVINEKVNPAEDFSMYRTPSGSYYCKTCNMTMCHVKALQQHLIGKKHIKKSVEEKEQTKSEIGAAK